MSTIAYTWNNPSSGDWDSASNWTPGSGPPTATDTATIDGTASRGRASLRAAVGATNIGEFDADGREVRRNPAAQQAHKGGLVSVFAGRLRWAPRQVGAAGAVLSNRNASRLCLGIPGRIASDS